MFRKKSLLILVVCFSLILSLQFVYCDENIDEHELSETQNYYKDNSIVPQREVILPEKDRLRTGFKGDAKLFKPVVPVATDFLEYSCQDYPEDRYFYKNDWVGTKIKNSPAYQRLVKKYKNLYIKNGRKSYYKEIGAINPYWIYITMYEKF